MQVRTALMIASLMIVAPRAANALRAAHVPDVSPTDGEVDVPTNAAIYAFTMLRQVGWFRIEDEHGVMVPATLEAVPYSYRDARVVRLRPVAELRPDHAYAIVTYTLRGGAMTAYRRMFRTGSGPDRAPPPAITIGRPRLTIREWGPDDFRFCEIHSHDVDLDLGITYATGVRSHLVTADGGQPTLVLPHEWDELAYRSFVGHTEACMTIQPQDLAGNLGPARRVCVTVNAPEPSPPGDRRVLAAILLIAAGAALAFARRRRRPIAV